MLKCFSFRYETLQDDEDEVYVDVNRLSSSSVVNNSHVTNKNNLNEQQPPKKTKKSQDEAVQSNRLSDEVPVPPRVPSRGRASPLILSHPPKQTWRLEKHECRGKNRKEDENLWINEGERYTRLPTSTKSAAVVPPSVLEIVPPPPPKTTRMPKRATPTEGGASGSRRDDDWSRSGSFFNKPSRGWIHSNKQLADGGISYGVRYIGCLDVNASMKSLDFETRSLVAKECINRVCEAAGLKTVDKKRKVEKKIARMLAEKPNMDSAGSNVNLTISSSSLNLAILESGDVIANHEMPNVSFASGGDPETLDFVAYVAKNGTSGRACYVLECGGGLAQDVITTIGQAFELRFKEYLKRAPRGHGTQNRAEMLPSEGVVRDDPEYYNDLPGKMPPESSPPVPPLPDYQNEQRILGETNDCMGVVSSSQGSVDNLIDLSSEPSSPNPALIKKAEHDYVNECMAELNGRSQSVRDPFDMQPFESSLPQANSIPVPQELNTVVPRQQPKISVTNSLHAQLLGEEWFHGPISRRDAESLLVHDGDFLVRESQGSPGQFVLSGMHHGTRKHLLLVDPEGVVRTKDRMFESVNHLVNYHRNNGLPIISADSALVLQNPIAKLRHSLR